MDGNFWVALLVALIGALAGVVGALLTGRQSRELERQKWQQDLNLEKLKHAQELEQERIRLTQELRVEYDKDVREKRIAAYKELWGLTRLFPGSEYKRVDEVTLEDLKKLLHQFHEWYFTQGKGLYLSKDSTDKYREFKVALQNVLKPGELEEILENSEQDKDLRAKAHMLRESLAKDVGTRVKLQGGDSNVSK